MKLALYIFLVQMLYPLAFAAPNRSPAVEDFIGIDVEQKGTPQDKVFYDLEQDTNKLSQKNMEQSTDVHAAQINTESTSHIAEVFGIFVILALPLLSWLLVLNHLRKKALVESASNIKVLDNFRKKREASLSKTDENEIKKAS